MGNKRKISLEEPIADIRWLDGVTVTPSGVHDTTKQEWREANNREFGDVLPEINVIDKHKKYSLDTAIPVDNTRVVIGPSRSPATQADSKKLNDANNRAIAANAEALYSVLRFIPYTKYLTDIGDITGWNPATAYKRNNGKDYTLDFSDYGAIIGGWPIDIINRNGKLDFDSSTGRTISKKHPYRRKVHNTMINRELSKGFVKYNPLRMVGILGDVIQGVNAAKELYDANKNLQQVKQSINWKQQPFSIDTGMSIEDRKN